MRRVNQRAQHVKQCAGFKLLANRHRVTKTGVIFRREQEANAQVIQRFTRTFGLHVQVDAERGQQVRRSGTAGDAAVTVFRYLQSTGRCNERTGGGDIDAVAAVTTCADNIRKRIVRTRERSGIFQQGRRGTGNLLRAFATHFHAHQRGRQLFRFQLAAHHGGEELVALLLAQGLCLIQFFQYRLQGIGLFQFL